MGKKICSITLVENTKKDGKGYEVVTILIDNRRIGYLKPDGNLVIASDRPEEFSSLDLFLLSRRSDELRRAEIERMQSLVKQLIKEGETLHD
jgi:hypothetical protein